MSTETLEWLNTNTLIGCADQRGEAWHTRKGHDNHYPAGIPVEDVRRRLFNFTVESYPVCFMAPCALDHPELAGINADGNPFRLIVSQQGRQGQVRSDNGFDLGVFSDGYQGHDYSEWLIENVEAMLGQGLVIGSAGLLKAGAVAWVQVEMPDTVHTPSGEELRPFLLAVTSFDGSVATRYKRGVTRVVCDNTLSLGLSEDGFAWSARHTRNSMFRIDAARVALDVLATHTIEQATNDYVTEAERLINTAVSDTEWSKLVYEITVPRDAKGKPITDDVSSSTATRMANKQAALNRMWETNPMVSMWKGTAWGALQAVSTFDLHESSVRGKARAERNMLAAVTGSLVDADVLRRLALVTA